MYSEKFTLKLYYLLSKYATKMKKTIEERAFETRIELLRKGLHQEYEKEYYAVEKEEMESLKNITQAVLSGLKIMEQDYIISLNFHSNSDKFKEQLLKIQQEISIEVFGDTLEAQVPESLNKELTEEIRDFARNSTNKIMEDASRTYKDQAILQEKLQFEIAKLDDVIYVEYGYRNKEVIKAFEKYNLLPKHEAQNATVAS